MRPLGGAESTRRRSSGDAPILDLESETKSRAAWLAPGCAVRGTCVAAAGVRSISCAVDLSVRAAVVSGGGARPSASMHLDARRSAPGSLPGLARASVEFGAIHLHAGRLTRHPAGSPAALQSRAPASDATLHVRSPGRTSADTSTAECGARRRRALRPLRSSSSPDLLPEARACHAFPAARFRSAATGRRSVQKRHAGEAAQRDARGARRDVGAGARARSRRSRARGDRCRSRNPVSSSRSPELGASVRWWPSNWPCAGRSWARISDEAGVGDCGCSAPESSGGESPQLTRHEDAGTHRKTMGLRRLVVAPAQVRRLACPAQRIRAAGRGDHVLPPCRCRSSRRARPGRDGHGRRVDGVAGSAPTSSRGSVLLRGTLGRLRCSASSVAFTHRGTLAGARATRHHVVKSGAPRIAPLAAVRSQIAGCGPASADWAAALCRTTRSSMLLPANQPGLALPGAARVMRRAEVRISGCAAHAIGAAGELYLEALVLRRSSAARQWLPTNVLNVPADWSAEVGEALGRTRHGSGRVRRWLFDSHVVRCVLALVLVVMGDAVRWQRQRASHGALGQRAVAAWDGGCRDGWVSLVALTAQW